MSKLTNAHTVDPWFNRSRFNRYNGHSIAQFQIYLFFTLKLKKVILWLLCHGQIANISGVMIYWLECPFWRLDSIISYFLKDLKVWYSQQHLILVELIEWRSTWLYVCTFRIVSWDGSVLFRNV